MQLIVLGGKEGLECEVCVDGMRLEHDKSVWRVFVRRNAWGVARGMNS